MSKWKSIDEELPEKGQNVLGWNRAKNEYFAGKFVHFNNASIGIRTDIVYYDEFYDKFIKTVAYVTHWQPFTEPKYIMKKSERAKIQKAIKLLSDDKWDDAMEILFPLAGMGKFAEGIDNMNKISIDEVKPNKNFKSKDSD